MLYTQSALCMKERKKKHKHDKVHTYLKAKRTGSIAADIITHDKTLGCTAHRFSRNHNNNNDYDDNHQHNKPSGQRTIISTEDECNSNSNWSSQFATKLHPSQEPIIRSQGLRHYNKVRG